ncbi:MAG: cysteine hydrolase family protein [Ignavibacteria bacterium]|nr:cysteine hydrolase family protein [Ignavibacteria bacterium]
MNRKQPRIPAHFDADKVDKIWKVNYQQLAEDARKWADEYKLTPAVDDKFKIALVLVDVQNTFCNPEFELFVGGRSGRGAIDDNIRLCEFIYRNLDIITEIIPTMDTHQAAQIFHSLFLLNDNGEHPKPNTLISYDDIKNGVWKINPDVLKFLSFNEEKAQQHLIHYTKTLKDKSKYDLTIWPYHAMLGGIGHALVPSVEEAIFYHSIARYSQPDFQIKGRNPLTEHYSVFGPEIRTDADGNKIADKNSPLLEKLMKYDLILIAGQAKSHCVAWTIDDLLQEDKSFAKKVYLLEDVTSPVVIPGVIDFTEETDKAFKKFADAGMHVVKTSDAVEEWMV